VNQTDGQTVRNRYRRFSYWLEPGEFSMIIGILGAEFVLHRAAKVLCEPLRGDIQIGYALPDVWDVRCSRQGSWFRASSKAKKILLVSSFDLAGYGLQPETIILESNFTPPWLPGKEEQLELVRLSQYTSKRPSEWEQVPEPDKDRILRQARGMGIRDPIDQILLSRSANHANFLQPRYYVRKEHEILPYSIGRSGNVCSACLEFFNIIGSEFRTKLVVPCVGAVLYAGMRVNKYYEVRSLAMAEPTSASQEALKPLRASPLPSRERQGP